MLTHQIGVVLCRVGAAILMVQAITSLGYSLPGLIYNDQEVLPEILVFSLMGIVPGLAAIGLWVFAERISTAPTQPIDGASSDVVSCSDVLRLGMTLLGIYFIIAGLVEAARIESIQFALQDMENENQSFLNQQEARTLGDRLAYLVQLILGVGLLIGRDRFAIFFAKAKHAGVDPG